MPGRRENMAESTLEVKDTVVDASSSKFIAWGEPVASKVLIWESGTMEKEEKVI